MKNASLVISDLTWLGILVCLGLEISAAGGWWCVWEMGCIIDGSELPTLPLIEVSSRMLGAALQVINGVLFAGLKG
jgi:hypothetical protein